MTEFRCDGGMACRHVPAHRNPHDVAARPEARRGAVLELLPARRDGRSPWEWLRFSVRTWDGHHPSATPAARAAWIRQVAGVFGVDPAEAVRRLAPAASPRRSAGSMAGISGLGPPFRGPEAWRTPTRAATEAVAARLAAWERAQGLAGPPVRAAAGWAAQQVRKRLEYLRALLDEPALRLDPDMRAAVAAKIAALEAGATSTGA